MSRESRRARGIKHAQYKRERERRYTERSYGKQYSSIRKDSGIKVAAEYKRTTLNGLRDKYIAAHQNIQTIKERLSNGEINQAIRYLHDKGIILGQFEYYEDFLEQHENEWDIEEVRSLLEEHEAQMDADFMDAITIFDDDGAYKPLFKPKDVPGLDFLYK